MLNNSLFTFTNLVDNGGTLVTQITLNNKHGVFQGHFPGQPVLPGACMIQMIKEVAEQHVGNRLQLIRADNIKFLAFIDPNQAEALRMELKITVVDENTRVDAQLLDANTTLFKFKGLFRNIAECSEYTQY